MSSADFFMDEEAPDSGGIAALGASDPMGGMANPYETAGAGGDDGDGDEKEDVFAGMGAGGANGASADVGAAGGSIPEKEDDSALAEWQAERRAVLQARADTEKATLKELAEEARADLKKYNEARAARIESVREVNRSKEQSLRDDLNSVFEHGTIWEQVAKMVNLNESTSARTGSGNQERMRALLIGLKNAKKEKK